MEQRKIALVDRLRDRGFVDQWGFVFFAFVGSVAIVAAKYFEVGATYVAVGAIGMMVVYAVLIARSGSGRLRSDQAGDNCYYLGLIYTLASLAYAIFFFDPANTATTIVQGFGIALATTIAGLVLRVFFNQGRPDLENVEEMARLELTQAAAALKTELGQVVRSMSDFSLQVKQAISETRDAATNDINTFTNTAIGGLQQVIDTARESLQSEAQDFASRTKKYGSAVDKLMLALDRHGDNLDRLNTAHEALAESASVLRTNAAASETATADLNSKTQEVAESVRALREGSDSVAGVVRQLSSMIEDMNRSVSELGREVTAHITELKAGPSAAVGEASQALGAAGAKLREELNAVAQVHHDASSAIHAQARNLLDRTRSNNQALEQELARSTELLNRVQSNLTDMTGVLVDKVRERP